MDSLQSVQGYFLALFLPDKGGFLLNIIQDASANSGFHNEGIYMILRIFYPDGGEFFTHITYTVNHSPAVRPHRIPSMKLFSANPNASVGEEDWEMLEYVRTCESVNAEGGAKGVKTRWQMAKSDLEIFAG